LDRDAASAIFASIVQMTEAPRPSLSLYTMAVRALQTEIPWQLTLSDSWTSTLLFVLCDIGAYERLVRKDGDATIAIAIAIAIA
jgi:hypothetical protein